MPLKSTNNLITSLVNFFKNATDNVLSVDKPFPRFDPPTELTNDTFEQEATEQYQKEMSEKKVDQNPDNMINRGNNYYFSLMVKKSYRLYTRSRIEAVSTNKSVEKGLASPVGFLTTKYKFLGDKMDPNDV